MPRLTIQSPKNLILLVMWTINKSTIAGIINTAAVYNYIATIKLMNVISVKFVHFQVANGW